MAKNTDTSEVGQEVASQLKEMSGYSKQLLDAINSIVKPMSQISDLTKAVKEQNVENARAIADAIKTIKDHETVQKSLNEGIIEQLASKNDLTDKERELLDIAKEQSELEKERAKLGKEHAERWSEDSVKAKERKKALESELGLLTKMKNEIREMYDKSALQMPSGVGRTTGTVSEVFTGRSRASEGLSDVVNSISSIIPMAGGIGGLLGFMIAGKMKEAEFEAIGQRARQWFDQVGGSAREFGGQLGQIARDLSSKNMAAEGDIEAVANAMARTGIKAKEAQSNVAGFSSEVGSSLVVATLAADKAFEMAAGSMAKMSGTLAQTFNTTAKEAFITLTNIGTAAEQSGQNAAVFMQQVLDASSALRMLNANYGSVGAMQLQFTDSLRKGGMNDQFAGTYAAGGIQSAMQSIANLAVGMSAVIGERMGGRGNGLDAWYSMKSGMTKDKLDPGAVAQELAKMAKEASGNRAEQVYFLTQTTGTTVSGAESILDAGKEYSDSGGKVTKATLAKLQSAFEDEREKSNKIETHLKSIKNILADMATGMLTAVVSTLKLIYHAIAAGVSYIIDGKNSEEFTGHRQRMQEQAASMTKGLSKVGSGFGRIAHEIGGVADTFELTQGWDIPTSKKTAQDKYWNDEKARLIETYMNNGTANGSSIYAESLATAELARRRLELNKTPTGAGILNPSNNIIDMGAYQFNVQTIITPVNSGEKEFK